MVGLGDAVLRGFRKEGAQVPGPPTKGRKGKRYDPSNYRAVEGDASKGFVKATGVFQIAQEGGGRTVGDESAAG